MIGFLPATNTGASVGFSRMAYQRAIIAMSICEAGEFAIARFEGTTPRAQSGPKTGIAQRARGGYCQCCTRATQVASPPVYSLGEFTWLVSRELALWTANGPWDPPRLAACQFAHDFGQLSESWDWAAHFLNISAPEPLERATDPKARRMCTVSY